MKHYPTMPALKHVFICVNSNQKKSSGANVDFTELHFPQQYVIIHLCYFLMEGKNNKTLLARLRHGMQYRRKVSLAFLSPNTSYHKTAPSCQEIATTTTTTTH